MEVRNAHKLIKNRRSPLSALGGTRWRRSVTSLACAIAASACKAKPPTATPPPSSRRTTPCSSIRAVRQRLHGGHTRGRSLRTRRAATRPALPIHSRRPRASRVLCAREMAPRCRRRPRLQRGGLVRKPKHRLLTPRRQVAAYGEEVEGGVYGVERLGLYGLRDFDVQISLPIG